MKTQERSPATRSRNESNSSEAQMQPVHDLVEYVKTYANDNPGAAALWCFGIGFVLGWRLKPW